MACERSRADYGRHPCVRSRLAAMHCAPNGSGPALGRKLWERGANGTGPMFATRTGNRLSYRNVRRVLVRTVAPAGLPRVSPHSFRHTHGSMLIDADWPLTEVAHLGSRYSHTAPGRPAETSLRQLSAPPLSGAIATASRPRLEPPGGAWHPQHRLPATAGVKTSSPHLSRTTAQPAVISRRSGNDAG